MMRRAKFVRVLAVLGIIAGVLSVRLPALADDTDLFTINPTVSSQRPNVLIVLDSSANWDQTDSVAGGKRSQHVLAAMAKTIDGLTDQFNVGLMMFAETGGGDDSVDGGVMRMGMRWMNADNRAALVTFFKSVDSGFDKSNNTSMGLAFAESLYYFSGRNGYSGIGKQKRDFGGNKWGLLSNDQQGAPQDMQDASTAIWNLPVPDGTKLPANALTDSAARAYNSPITDACQKNFIIYISNGPFSDPTNSNVDATNRLAAEGGNTNTILFTQNTGLQGNISDEWARFLSSPDPNNSSRPIVVSYTVEVNPGTTGQQPNTTELLKSIATQGKGKYFGVSSAGGGAEISDALNKIFAEIAAVNSVFASSTLPVSVNVRGAFLNQVYMGVFRPDANSSPRWPGNVKHYALGADTTGNVFLVDKNGNPIENQTTGFVSPNAISYWTMPSTFWDTVYYPGAVAQPPLPATNSDSPDGEFVEKGGAAQRLRDVYASTINDATTHRNLYTCLGCATDSDLTLSSNHFNTANAAITDTLLGISGVKSVNSLNRVGSTVTASVTSHNFTNGQIVTISGANQVDYNVTANVTVVDSDTFTYQITERPISPATATQGLTLKAAKGGSTVGISSITLLGTTATVTTVANHSFSNNQAVSIAGAQQAEYNGTFNITYVNPTSFTYPVVTGPRTPPTALGNVSVVHSGGTANSAISGLTRNGTTVTVDTASNVLTGNVTCSNVTISNMVPAIYDVLARSCTKTGVKQFTFQLLLTELTPASPATTLTSMSAAPAEVYGIASITRPVGSGLVTVTTTATHTFNNGDPITISGAAQVQYNGVFSIANANQIGKTFTYTITPLPLSPATGTIKATGASGITRDNLINWVRGENVQLEDNPVLASTRVRGYLHGDVLHSRPAVINYNRSGQPAERDLVVFYGANDGIVHAVKGGQDDTDGYEKWGFVPSEFLPKFARIYGQSPIISSNNPRSYFADGPISVNAEYVTDNSVPEIPQDRIQGTGARAQIYVGMRRGGRFYYSLDVTNPDKPVFKWKIDNTMKGFEELGQTWSQARVVKLKLEKCPGLGGGGGICKVLIFGAGYDAAANDPETQTDAKMGRGIFVVDAVTGERIWHTGPSSNSDGEGFYLQTEKMLYAIPADLSVINSDLDVSDLADRIYATDTGGNIWRVNISDSDPANWTVGYVASLRTSGAENARKFLFAPDVVPFDTTTDSILIGSGDREHPHETAIANRYYMIKDKHGINDLPDLTATESDLCDLSSNNLQGTDTAAITADKTCLANKRGWMIRLVGPDPKDPTNAAKRAPGEKTVTGATTLGGTVIFATNTPKQTKLADGQCTGSLGTALVYAINFRDATSTIDFDGSGIVTQSERFVERAGGGFPPTAIPFSVKIGDKYFEGAITGTKVVQPPTAPIGQRYRVFWNLSIDN